MDSPTPPDLQTRNSPIIVGERYDLAETVALKQSGGQNGGLLAKPDYQTALLSMSGYDGKNGPEQLEGMQDGKMYGWAANPTYESGRTSRSSVELYGPRGPEALVKNGPGSSYSMDQHSSRQQSVASPRSMADVSSRTVPEVKSFNPERGSGGTHMHVYLHSHYDLFAPPAVNIYLSFGVKSVLTDFTKLETNGSGFEYIVLATAPHFPETGAQSTKVDLRLSLQDETGHTVGDINLGEFEYTITQPQTSPSLQGMARKRRMSEDNGSQSVTSSPAYNSFSFSQNVGPEEYGSAPITPYGAAQMRSSTRSVPLGATSMLQHSPGQASTASWSSSSYPVPGRGPSNFDNSSVSLSVSNRHPEFICTTSLGSGSGSSSSASTYNYPQKALLKINGDLNSMTDGWTQDEWNSKRRLVQFSRSQIKSTINASFAPVALEDRQLNSICISCIWWEERQEFFATSVDTIYLLEQLVAVRFTVEEKNRIRRNLEGFHPETVSKAKPDSEEFFKVIMGFPNPKPRNIEKDVKVFPWKILGHALKKIISKYSASYSSAPSGSLGRPRPTVSQSYDQSYYDAPGTGNSLASGYAASVTSNYSEPTEYAGSTHSTPFLGGSSTMAGLSQAGAYAPQFRAGSASELDPTSGPRAYKRARSNTSNATLYTQPGYAASEDGAATTHHHSLIHPALAGAGASQHHPYLGEMARSYSDHAGTLTARHATGGSARLPALNEGYALDDQALDQRQPYHHHHIQPTAQESAS